MKTVLKMAYSTSPCFWDSDQKKKLEPDIYIYIYIKFKPKMVEQTSSFASNSICNSNLESRDPYYRKMRGETVLHCSLKRECSTLKFNFSQKFCHIIICLIFFSPIMKKKKKMLIAVLYKTLANYETP